MRLISESKVPSGYGIRHLVFSKDGTYIYAVNELVPSVSVFEYAKGKAELVNTVKINCKNEKANGAAIRLSDDGKYLYVSLREENAICVYEVNGEELTLVQKTDCGGDSPRDFNIVDKHLIVCNEKSGNVAVLSMRNGLVDHRVEKISIKNALSCV